MIPDPKDDPCRVAEWILSTEFPLDDEERYLLKMVRSTRYTQEPNSVRRLHELRILYWQVVGWLRGKGDQ